MSPQVLQIGGLILIFAVMYLLMIRPQRKRQKQVEEMRSALRSGDRITTIGGLKGKVIRVGDEDITIAVGGEKLKLEFMKWAVSKVDERGSGKSSEVDTASASSEPDPEEVKAKKPRRLGASPDGANDADEKTTEADE